MNRNADNQIVFFLFLAVAILIYRYRHRPAGTAFGTATWASDRVLRKSGMLAGKGIVLGRTLGGALIQLPHFCHGLLVGGSGSGKGVGIIIPNLIRFFGGSVLCFDPKGDLFKTTAERRRAQGERIIRLAPFNGGKDAYNPLDSINDGPMLVDSARAMAEAVVARNDAASDFHWDDKSVQVICALIVLVLLRFKSEERSLNTVQEIASDPELLFAAAEKLREIGGIPGRLGAQLKPLFDKDAALTKEGAGVLSTVSRHLAFLDSELVAKSVASSTFDPADLRKPGTT